MKQFNVRTAIRITHIVSASLDQLPAKHCINVMIAKSRSITSNAIEDVGWMIYDIGFEYKSEIVILQSKIIRSYLPSGKL